MEDASLSSKAVSRSVTLAETFWDKVDEHARKVAGDRSKYIRKLIERDLAGGEVPKATAVDFLEQLCELLAPSHTAELRQGLEQHQIIDRQKLVAANLLHGFIRYLHRREAIPLTRRLLLDAPSSILGLDELAILVGEGDDEARRQLAARLREQIAELSLLTILKLAQAEQIGRERQGAQRQHSGRLGGSHKSA